MRKFRISAHNLGIERGIYILESLLPLSTEYVLFSVLVTLWKMNIHILMTCKKTDNERRTNFNPICVNFKFSDKDIFTFMMTREGKITKNLATFIYNHFPRTPATYLP